MQVTNSLIVQSDATLEAQRFYGTCPPTTCNVQPAPAFEMTVTVAGSANLASQSAVNALLSVPTGPLFIGDMVNARGAFSAFSLTTGRNCVFNHDSGFSIYPGGQQPLHGYYGQSPYPIVAPVIGLPAPDDILSLDIGLPTRVNKDHPLKYWVQQVSDPHSANYRKYLTQAQFAADFGATSAQYSQLTTWATSNGFVIDHTFPTNLLLSVHATVAQVEHALYVNLVLRQRPDGSAMITTDREPSVDLPPSGPNAVPILWIGGLTDFLTPVPLLGGTTNGTYQRTGSFAAADFRNAYLLGTAPGVPGLACQATTVPSGCQGLTGNGQVVGVYSYRPPSHQDIATYDGQQTTGIIASNLLPDVEIGGGFVPSASSTETPMDVEMVQAMAPAATVIVFDETPFTNLLNLGQVDGAFASMANSKPPLTIMTSSWEMEQDGNEQQSIYQMAVQGVSIFQASGDFGDLDDPRDVRDLDGQTLVGGTFLSTAGPSCSEAYTGEGTWNNGVIGTGTGATGGGVMNGNQNLDVNGNLPPGWVELLAPGVRDVAICDCFPYPFCCPGPVKIPEYQIPLQAQPLNPGDRNKGSNEYRNYPDVSMAASNIGEFVNGNTFNNGGTSAAAPLWAGFMALVNELSVQNNAGTIGFANPVLYEIGQTRGASVDDLYSKDFHDIADGVTNGPFGNGGYPSVPGYDLATGLGSPTCNLAYQLATTTPLTPNTPLYWVDFVVTTGGDDLRDNSGAFAAITFHGGAQIGVPLKGGQVGETPGPEWNDGSMVAQAFFLPCAINNYSSGTCLAPKDIPTESSGGIDSVTIKLEEDTGNSSIDNDNWDIAGLNVRLAANPGGDVQESCQLDMSGGNTLSDGRFGLARLTGDSQQATFAKVFLPNPPAGPVFYHADCAASGHPVPYSGSAIQPGIQFIFSTGSDDLRSDSGLRADFYAQKNSPTPFQTAWLHYGGSGAWATYTQQNEIFTLNGPVPHHIVLKIQQGNSGLETDDNWNCNGVNIMTWQPNGPEVCYSKIYQTAAEVADNGAGPFPAQTGRVFNLKDGTVTFGHPFNCQAIAGQ